VRLHARPDQLDAVDPVAYALCAELRGLGRDGHRVGDRAGERRAEHEGPAEEADEVVLLRREPPDSVG
jgi:hypothetical protein